MVNCVCQVAWWSFCREIWKDGKKGAGTILPEVLSYVTSEQYEWMHWTVTTPLAEVDKLLNYWSTIAISHTCAECELINLTWLFLLGMFCWLGLMMFILSICTNCWPSISLHRWAASSPTLAQTHMAVGWRKGEHRTHTHKESAAALSWMLLQLHTGAAAVFLRTEYSLTGYSAGVANWTEYYITMAAIIYTEVASGGWLL